MNLMTHDAMVDSRTLSRPSTASHGGVTASIAHTLDVWRTRSRDRNTLAMLDRRELRDLGVSNWEVERELTKPFWRE
jgi:uncharacterized protein YjiS (DUF1127 family)